jgi:hypothetical protein
MTIASLLCWYDESPEFLAAHVATLPLAGVSELIALDGAYSYYPGGRRASPASQYDTLNRAAKVAGIRLLLRTPGRVWATEMEKRTALFTLALSRGHEWLLVLDADERIINAPGDLRERLAAAHFDVAQATLLDAPSTMLAAQDADGDPIAMRGRHVKYRRTLFRALPGLRVTGRHSRYFAADGRCLWGDPLWGDRPEPALRLRDLVIDHRIADRPAERRAAANASYAARDDAGLEALPG